MVPRNTLIAGGVGYSLNATLCGRTYLSQNCRKVREGITRLVFIVFAMLAFPSVLPQHNSRVYIYNQHISLARSMLRFLACFLYMFGSPCFLSHLRVFVARRVFLLYFVLTCILPFLFRPLQTDSTEGSSYGTYEDIVSFLMIGVGGVYFLLVGHRRCPPPPNSYQTPRPCTFYCACVGDREHRPRLAYETSETEQP